MLRGIRGMATDGMRRGEGAGRPACLRVRFHWGRRVGGGGELFRVVFDAIGEPMGEPEEPPRKPIGFPTELAGFAV